MLRVDCLRLLALRPRHAARRWLVSARRSEHSAPALLFRRADYGHSAGRAHSERGFGTVRLFSFARCRGRVAFFA
jgi:hypothetical protein